MALQITVTFPCSDEEYKRTLIVLNAMHKSDFVTTPISQPAFVPIEADDSVLEEFTEDELALLDYQLGKAHDSDETPVLSIFETVEVPSLKVNRSQEIRKYFEKHPGASKYECVNYLATKLADFYPSRDIAMRRLGILIGGLTHQKILLNKMTNNIASYFVAEEM